MAAVGSGIYLDRTNKYLFALKVVTISSTISILSAVYLLPTGNLWFALLFCLIGGFSIVPIMPVCFALGTESTHPVSPALVIGLMMSGAQLMLFFINFLYLYFLPVADPHPRVCLLVMAINPLIAIVLACFVKEDLRRLSSILSVSMISRSKSRSGSDNYSPKSRAGSALSERQPSASLGPQDS